MSVNLSGAQIIQPNLSDQITRILSATELDPKYLVLEITESKLIEKPDYVAKILVKLRDLNIKLSLDDFGTGYSSLSYLQRFPVNHLKLDRSFVDKMTLDPDSLEIVRATILLGKALGMKIVAEGIETIAQMQLLQQMQCDYGQGYHFAKPLSVAEVEGWLALSQKH